MGLQASDTASCTIQPSPDQKVLSKVIDVGWFLSGEGLAVQSGGSSCSLCFSSINTSGSPFSKRIIPWGMDVVTRELVSFKYNSIGSIA